MTDRNSHSLFQGKYLGSTLVDRRCSKALLSWIIEELLLSKINHKSIWFSPGENKISFVKDDGTELLDHVYGEITHFTVLKDRLSFGYLVKSPETKLKFYGYQAVQKADVGCMIRFTSVNGFYYIVSYLYCRLLGLKRVLKVLLMATRNQGACPLQKSVILVTHPVKILPQALTV